MMAEDTGQGVTGTAGGRHYRKGHQVTHREDMTHEYKGHRCISVYDLPAHMTTSDPGADLRRTKSAVSASVCGMLNTGFGGTVYLGVDDGGRVVGLPLTSSSITSSHLSPGHYFVSLLPSILTDTVSTSSPCWPRPAQKPHLQCRPRPWWGAGPGAVWAPRITWPRPGPAGVTGRPGDMLPRPLSGLWRYTFAPGTSAHRRGFPCPPRNPPSLLCLPFLPYT